MDGTREGGCQCGEIRYEISGDPLTVAVCHCTDCQQQSGSAFGISMVVRREAFRILKGEPRSYTKTADSGNTVECLFCGTCGNRIFHRPSAFPGNLNLKPGTLDDTSWIEPGMQVWTSSRQPWVTIQQGVAAFEKNPTARS